MNPTIRVAFLLSALWIAAPASGEGRAPTLAASLRSVGPLIVADCGEDRPHEELADKVADELRHLRGGVRPERAACGDLDRLHWRGANVVLLASEPAAPALLAVAPGIGLRERGSGLDVVGLQLAGDEPAAALCLPHPHHAGRWVIVLYGTTPAALRGLDRRIRNDIAASALLLDAGGERMASLVWADGGWGVQEGHPYAPADVRDRFDAWRERTGAQVARWRLDVGVAEGEVTVAGEVEVEGDVQGQGELWLQVSARAEVLECSSPCAPHDAGDGRVLVRMESPEGVVSMAYRLPLEGVLLAWYVGETGGYVMPESNWFPRIRGEADDPYAARGRVTVDLATRGGAASLIKNGDERTPLLVWGDRRRVGLSAGVKAYLPAGAPDEVEQRARGVARAVSRHTGRGRPLTIVAVDRPAAWYGDGLLLAPPQLLQPGPLDDLDGWLVDRALSEHQVRIEPAPGRAVTASGRVAGDPGGVTARLWRARGTWWEQVDEGPVAEDGTFELSGRGKGRLLVTAGAAGRVPGRAEAAADDVVLETTEVAEVALLCFRCGPDQSEERFAMAPDGTGRFRITLTMGELFREFGSFPYAFEVNPGRDDAVVVLDPRRPPSQFPSFLDPQEFHADQVTFELDVERLRFWVETPGMLIAPQGWLD